MNHIYKVIFNKATGTFMAVAEYAKSHSGGGGVSSSATGQVGNSSVICLTRVATLAILAIAAMFNASAYAAEGSVALGQMTGRGDQYSTGKNAAAEGGYSIAVGEYSTAKGDQSIAIGGGQGKGSASNALTVGATALGKESIAIGGDVTAKGHASVAIGSDDLYLGETQGNTIDLINEHSELKRIKDAPATINSAANLNKYERTTASGHASVSVGTMSKALGDFANAFGTRAVADGAFSVAVGLTSKTTGKSSLALGSASKAKADQAIAIGSQTEAEGIGAIAIGADGKDTTVINTKSSTVGTGQSSVNKTNKEHYKDIVGGYLENTNSLDPFATAKTKSKDGAIAIGSQAYGEGVWSNAFGVRARSEGFASTAVGTGSHAQGKGSVALGAGANATENWSVAIGAGSIAQGTGDSPNTTKPAYIPTGQTLTADQKGTDKYGVVSVGRDTSGDVVRRRITNVGAGASDTDAVNVAQLKAVEAIAKKAGGGGGTTTTVTAGDSGHVVVTNTNTNTGTDKNYTIDLGDDAKNAINKFKDVTATKDDINKVTQGIRFTADTSSNNASTTISKKLGDELDIKGGKSSINDLTDNNIGVVAENSTLKIKLAKELNGLTKVAVTGNNNTNAELLNGGLTFTQTGANAGKTVYGTDGLKFTTTSNSAKHQTVRITNEKIGFSGTDGTVANNLPYMHKDGINMTSKKITSLANGTADTDAVTIKQLKGAKPNIIAGTGINITNGNNGNLVDTNTGNVTTPTYTIGVKTTELSSNGNGANKFSVSGTNNNSALVTADKLKDYLNQVNQTANNAKQEATTAKSTAEAAKSTANAATSTANQAQQSAQTAQQNAQKSASEAQTAKTAAQNSATQAQTAQQQATQANQSAQQAKQQAATSAQQAQQAKTAAESAKSDATNAKTAAEAAKAAASNVKYKTSSSGTAQNLNVSDSKPLTFEQGDNITLEESSDGTLKISSTARSNYKAWKLNTENGTAETINNNDEVKFIGKKTTTTTGNQPPHQNIKITQNTTNKKELEFALNDELKLNPSTGYLSVGNTTLNNGGLTVYKSDFTEQLQLGADGIKFADTNGRPTIGTPKQNSTRITSSGVGFSKIDGTLDEAQPHIKASGINAGNQAISNVKEATQDTDAVNKGQVNKLIQGKIKPVELTVNDSANNQSSRFDVKDTDKDGFVTADKLKEYLNKVDQSADIAKTNAESANQQAANAKSESEKAKNEAAAAKTTANDNKTKLDNLGDTSQLKQNVDKALQTFKVQKDGDNTNTITVGKNSTASNDTVNTLKLKGENGLDVKTNKNGTVTFGVDTTKGLTAPKLTVGSNNGNGIVIDSQNGQNTITGLSSTLPSITNTGNAHTTAQGNTITNDKDKSNAANIADVLNAGFNLQGNGNSVDFVSTYDTVNFTNGNATTAKVTYDGDKQTSTVVYDINVDDKTIEITSSDKKLSVKTTTLTKTNGTANTNFSAGNNGDALVKAKDIASNLNDLAKEISTAKGTVGNALQSLTVKGGNDENTNNGITLNKTSNDLTVAGDNGITVKTDAAKKKVTVGIDTTGGLKVGNSALNNGGLTVKNGNEQIQVGADGVKFADVNGGTVGVPKVGTTRITKDDIGFAGADGAIDKQLPYLDKKQLKIGQVEITKDSGINAGNQEITNVKSAIADANGQTNQSFVTRLGTAGKDTNKRNSAATVKDLYDLSQSPLTFAGDTGNGVNKKLGDTLTVKGGETNTGKLTDGNIGVVADSANGLTVKLAKTLNDLEAVNTQNLNATSKITVGSGNNTAELLGGGLSFIQTISKNAGKTVYGVDGLKFTDNNNAPLIGTTRITSDHIGFAKEDGTLDAQAPHLDKNRLKVGAVEITKDSGINAGNQKITNIADGKNDTDAVSYKQHKQVADKLDGLDKNALDQVKTALQTFKVQNGDDETNAITVGKDTNGDKVNTLKFKGENGVDVKTKKDGTVTFGIDQSKGLTAPKLTVGSNTDGNGNKVSIDKDNGIHFLTKDGNKDTNAPAITKDGINTGGKAITGLTHTLTDATNPNTGHVSEIKGLAQDADKTRAASIGDVLNAGFNLQGNGTAVDFVSTYDTVNFTNGNATTAKVTYDETSKTSKVAYDVNVDDTTIHLTGNDGSKKLGVKTTTITKTDANGNATTFSTTDDNALVKAKDIATHLNTLAGDIQTAKGASQAGNSAGYVDADGNKVIYDSTDKKYYQVNGNGQADKTKEVAKDKLVAQAQTPDGTLAQMNVKSVITKEKENDANGINEDNAFVKGLETAAKDTKTKNAAVTVNDLHQVASTPITFKSDDGVHSQVNLGDTFAMTGGADYTNLSDGKNIGVVSQPNGVQFKLAKDLTNLNSVSAGGTRIDEKGVSFVEPNGQAKANTPVLSANGLDMGGKRISNIGAAVNDNDAVNFKQFNEVAKTVNTLNNQSNSGASLPFVVTDANGNPVNGTDGKPQKAIKGTDGKYYQANANGVPVDKDGNPITDADKLANLAAHGKPLDTGHQVVAKLGGNSDAITLTNIKATLPQIATPNTGNNTNAGQAQSLPSLSASQQSNAASVKDVLNVGFNLQTNNNQVDFVKAYDTVNFVNGTGADITSMRNADGTMSNITVNTALAATDDNGNVLIKAKDGKFYKADDLMPNGSLKAGKSANDAKTPAGLSLVNPNADKGSTGDAVALNNLSEAVFKAKDGTTTTVNSDGISIKGKDNSNIALSKDGLDMGGKVISNVGKGTKDTDAANMQQLNEVRSLLGLGNAGNGNAGGGNAGNAGGGQVNIVDIKKDPNSGSGSSSNSPAIKAGTVLGGKGNNDTERLANGGVQVGVDKDGNANGDLNNVWVKTQKDGSKKALLTTYNVEGQTNYVTNNPAEAIDKMNEQGIRFFHVNDGNQEPVVQGRNSIDSSASGKHSAAVGYKAKANGEAAVAVGRQTQAGNQSIAIGDKAQATGNQSIAIGTGNVVTGKHSGAIGDPSTVKADNSYSVGNNNQFTDATQSDVFGVGNNITVTESNSVALGSNSAISAGTQAGTQAKKSDGTAGATTTAGATGTVKGFAGQTAVGAVSVGASGAERRIQNVAAGEVSATSTDAVNGSQLYKATQGIANATNELGHRIHQNENKANAGISSAMAMASMPQAYIPGRSMVTGGIATYNGQGAVAVGLSKLSDNGQWIFKINGSADTQGNAGAAVGAGFHW